MDHEKKLAWIQKMTKMGLDSIPHYDGGGLVGGIQSALGLNNNFQAGNANLNPGTTNEQLGTAYTGAQNALANQNTLVNTVAPQAQQGVNQQNQLAQMYTNEANGVGPNVAQNQLNQATGQNIASQAALAAGTRGAGANAGLIARENAQQGAATQQQAAGQAATLGAQQQIAAQQNLANLSATQVAQAGQGINGLNNAQQNEQNILQGANTAYNNANVGMQSNLNNVNGQVASGNQAMSGNILGSIEAGGSAALSMLGGSSSLAALSEGGEVKSAECYADGGPIVGNPLVASPAPLGPQSFAGQWLNSTQESSSPMIAQQAPQAPQQSNDMGKQVTSGIQWGQNYKENHPSLDVGPAQQLDASVFNDEMMAAKGGKVKADKKGEKAVKSDNSYDNDKIPAMLSEGEIVLPRSVTMHPMAPEKAAEFVRKIQAKKGMKDVKRGKQ